MKLSLFSIKYSWSLADASYNSMSALSQCRIKGSSKVGPVKNEPWCHFQAQNCCHPLSIPHGCRAFAEILVLWAAEFSIPFFPCHPGSLCTDSSAEGRSVEVHPPLCCSSRKLTLVIPSLLHLGLQLSPEGRFPKWFRFCKITSDLTTAPCSQPSHLDCPRPRWMGLGTTWGSGRCPCPWQGWEWRGFRAPSIPNYSGIPCPCCPLHCASYSRRISVWMFVLLEKRQSEKLVSFFWKTDTRELESENSGDN